MADMFQGAALPDVNVSQAQSTTAPAWYTDYLKNIAQQGTTGATGAQYAGTQPLQQQAFNLAQTNVGAASPYLSAAYNALTATQPSALSTANPYLQAATGTAGAAGAASPYLAAATQTNPLSGFSPYATQAASTSGMSAASPYLQSAGAMSPLSAFSPYASQAAQTSGAAAAMPFLAGSAASSADLAGQYMNPYTQNVVSEIGRLGAKNIQENLAPAATAGAVGSGQFGSQRGAQVLGQTIRDALSNISGQQGAALAGGYQSAVQAAQADLARQLQAGQTLGQLTGQQAQLLGQLGSTAGGLTAQQAQNLLSAGSTAGSLTQQQANTLANLAQSAGALTGQQAQNLLTAAGTSGQLTGTDLARQLSAGQAAGQMSATDLTQQLAKAQQMGALGQATQQSGLADINALSTLGSQQQQIAQNQQLFPLQTAQLAANLLKGVTVPTDVTSKYTGPMPGAYSSSPLSQIAGLGSLIAGLYDTPTGSTSPLISQILGTSGTPSLSGGLDWLKSAFGGGSGG